MGVRRHEVQHRVGGERGAVREPLPVKERHASGGGVAARGGGSHFFCPWRGDSVESRRPWQGRHQGRRAAQRWRRRGRARCGARPPPSPRTRRHHRRRPPLPRSAPPASRATALQAYLLRPPPPRSTSSASSAARHRRLFTYRAATPAGVVPSACRSLTLLARLLRHPFHCLPTTASAPCAIAASPPHSAARPLHPRLCDADRYREEGRRAKRSEEETWRGEGKKRLTCGVTWVPC